MKIWKGKEKEVKIFEGTEMLFIQGETVDMFKVLDLAKEHNIRQLYFGAGKVEFKDFEKLKEIPKNKYVIIVETTKPEQIPSFHQNITVIYRIESREMIHDTVVKVETANRILTVYIKDMYETMKSSLKSETLMYEDDKLLWEDKKIFKLELPSFAIHCMIPKKGHNQVVKTKKLSNERIMVLGCDSTYDGTWNSTGECMCDPAGTILDFDPNKLEFVKYFNSDLVYSSEEEIYKDKDFDKWNKFVKEKLKGYSNTKNQFCFWEHILDQFTRALYVFKVKEN